VGHFGFPIGITTVTYGILHEFTRFTSPYQAPAQVIPTKIPCPILPACSTCPR
jgi:hypothetical protein